VGWHFRGGISEVQYRHGKLEVLRSVRPELSVIGIRRDLQGFYWIITSNATDKKNTFWRTQAPERDWQPVVSSAVKGSIAVDFSGRVWYDAKVGVTWLGNYPNTIVANTLLPNKELIYISSSGPGICLSGPDSLYFFSAENQRLRYQVAYKFPEKRPVAMGYLYTPQADYIYRISNGPSISSESKESPDFFSDTAAIQMAFTMASDINGTPYISDFGNGFLIFKKPYLRQYETKGVIKRIAFQGTKTSFCTEHTIYSVNENQLSLTAPPVYNIHFIAANNDGSFFIGEHNRIFHNGKLMRSPHESFFDFSDIISSGAHFFISSYTFGLLRWANGKHDAGWKVDSLPSNTIEKLACANGNLYALTLNHGLFQIDTSGKFQRSFTRQQGLLSNSVFDVLAETDTLWIATNKGLNAVARESITAFGSDKGFVGNRAVCVFRDGQKRLWVLSDKYLHHVINGRLYAVRSHPVLVDNRVYISTAKFNQATNTLWIGTNQMMLAMDMNAVQPTDVSRVPYVGYLSLGDQEFSQNMQQLNLSYNHKPLHIGLGFSQNSIVNRPEIYYRFKGLDDVWRKPGTDLMILQSRLPQGRYTLEAMSVGPDYGSVPPKSLLTINVSPPWWKQIWFLLLCLLLAAAIAFGVGALYNKRRYKARLQAMKAMQAVENERSRISRELHDNVGSMLTLMVNRLNDGPRKSADELGLDKIAHDTLNQLRDAIWALNQRGLTLGQWNARTHHFLRQLNGEGLKADAEFSWQDDRHLSPIEALHTFRIVQESCTNAIRHGKATIIKVTGTYAEKDCLTLVIYDNGIGFDSNVHPMGYGLRNMQNRAMDLNGQLTIESDVNKGTRVRLVWCPDIKNTPFG
jgi:signal transduction histidine kinase